MTDSGDNFVDCNEVFDKLVNEISNAQAELDMIQEQLKNQVTFGGLKLEAATLQEETNLWRKEAPEGFVEDDQIRYYLAIGTIEQQVKEMRAMKELSRKTLDGTKETLTQINKSILKQAALVKKMEHEFSEIGEKSGDKEMSDFNMTKRKELNELIRMNKLIVRQMKNDLKLFIDETANLNPDYSPGDGSPFGYLLQALWKNFLDQGPSDYISIESLDFDVPHEVLEQLVRGGIVEAKPSDPNLIKMVDFTMST